VARPPLPVGTHGAVNTVQIGPKLWRARTRFRDFDGTSSLVQRTGRSKTAAQNNLKEALRDRAPVTGSDITPDTKLASVVARFLAQVKRAVDAGDMSDGTLRLYKSQTKNYIIPGMGALLVRECTVPRCNGFLVALRERQGDEAVGPDTLKTVKSVLSGALGLAVRHGALDANPLREVERIKGAKRTPRALTAEERADFLSKLDASKEAVEQDLPDLTRLILATGVRVGEALAILWTEVDLDAGTVKVSHHVVRVTGVGLIRTKGTKGGVEVGVRLLQLPSWAVEMLRRRRPDIAGETLVFPSSTTGGLRDPSAVGKKYRKARDKAGYEWFTSHNLRKTVATILDEAGMSARAIADQLGKSDVNGTQRDYIGPRLATGAAAAAVALEVAAPVRLRPVSGE
jgi:integrase